VSSEVFWANEDADVTVGTAVGADVVLRLAKDARFRKPDVLDDAISILHLEDNDSVRRFRVRGGEPAFELSSPN